MVNGFQFKVFQSGEDFPQLRAIFADEYIGCIPKKAVQTMSRNQKPHRFQSGSIVTMILMLSVGIFAGWQAQAGCQDAKVAGAIHVRSATGLGYLAVVGPVQVRFEPPDTNTLAILKAVMHLPVAAVTSITNAISTNTMEQAVKPADANSAEENGRVAAVPRTAIPEIDAVTNQAVGSDVGGSGGIEGVNNISGAGPSSASDLLPVAASMITEYLKPSQSQTTTNRADRPGATVFVPLQTGFTPPLQQAPVPESRAVYKSQ